MKNNKYISRYCQVIVKFEDHFVINLYTVFSLKKL